MKNSFNPCSSITMILFLLLINATGGIHAQVLPDSWQPGMRLITSYGGGMRRQTDTVIIRQGRSYERHQGMDNNSSFSCIFSAQELNDLLHFLKRKKFDKIKPKERLGIVDDMGSSTILLQWVSNVVGVSSSDTQLVPELFEKNLSDIYSCIEIMIETMKKQGRPSRKK